MIRTLPAIALLCFSTAAVAEPLTINGKAYEIQYDEPNALGIATNRVTVDGRTYTTCERITPIGWGKVACPTGQDIETRTPHRLDQVGDDW
jgi:hypothetical protein